MGDIATRLRIYRLKQQAAGLYIRIHTRSDGLSCGAHLADFIRPDIPKMEVEFNRIMAELAEIDPEARKLVANAR